MRIRQVVTILAFMLLISALVAAQQQQRSEHDQELLRTALQNKPANSIFIFHTDEFWLNLHHFLYVLGRAQNKTADASRAAVSSALSHSLIFFTAGEAVRRVAQGYVPYAEKYGVWQRGMIQLKQPIEQTWKPYLDGKGTRDEAFAELLKLTGESKP